MFGELDSLRSLEGLSGPVALTLELFTGLGIKTVELENLFIGEGNKGLLQPGQAT